MPEPKKFRTCPNLKCKAEFDVEADECPKCKLPVKAIERELDIEEIKDALRAERKGKGEPTSKKGPWGY